MTAWAGVFPGRGSRPVWRNFRSVHILRTRTSRRAWDLAGPRPVAGAVEQSGKVPGQPAAEDVAVPLYCARVTQRYVKKGKVHIRGYGRTVGNGYLHGDLAGRPGPHREPRLGRGPGAESGELGAGDLERDGRSAADVDGEPEAAAGGVRGRGGGGSQVAPLGDVRGEGRRGRGHGSGPLVRRGTARRQPDSRGREGDRPQNQPAPDRTAQRPPAVREPRGVRSDDLAGLLGRA